MTNQPDALTLVRTFLEAFNRGDRAAALALLAEDVTVSEPLEPEGITGPEAVIANLWSYRNTFPDLHTDETDAFAAGDRAVVQFTSTGTYEPFTFGANAKRITWRGCIIARAYDGLIVRIDSYLDWLGPVQQLEGQAFAPHLEHEAN